MIYITGDTHSDFRRFQKSIFPEQKEMTKEDYNLDELNNRSFTTLFVPGNHENYARLMSDEFPVKEWNGGMVKEIRPSILMLMRGEMYKIDRIKFFTFGGASSHDITDKMLDGADPDWKTKALQLRRWGKYYFRIKGIS